MASVSVESVALAQDLEAGRVDVGIDSYATGVYAQSAGGYAGIKILVSKSDPRVQSSVEPAQSGLLYTEGSSALGAAMDDGVNKMHGDEMHGDRTIATLLEDAGLDPSGADVGAPRMRQ